MSVSVQVLRTAEEVAELQGEWAALLERAHEGSPFLTWDWMYAWWESYCANQRERRPAVIVARRSGALVGILPGYLRPASTPGLGLTEFAFLGTEHESSDYLRPIQEDGTKLLPAMLQALKQHEPDVDIAVFDNVLEADGFLGSLQSAAAAARYSFETESHRTCPYLAIASDWEEYVATLSPKMRKNVRRAMRQVVDAGAEFSLVDRRVDVADAVRDLFELHARRFVSKNGVTGFGADRMPFHVNVGHRFFDRDILRIFRVRTATQTVAVLYCYEYGNNLYYVQSGFDPAWDKLSVGTALVGYAIKHAFDKRLGLFDFMRGDEEYKYRWTSTSRQIVIARVGVSWRGRAGLTMRRQGLRAKRLAKRLIRPHLKQAPSAAVPV